MYDNLILVAILTITLIGSHAFAYLFGYKHGAYRVLRQWETYTEEVDEE